MWTDRTLRERMPEQREEQRKMNERVQRMERRRKRIRAVGDGQPKRIRKGRIPRISRILQHMPSMGTQGGELPTRKRQMRWKYQRT